jgi:hypothetical protein
MASHGPWSDKALALLAQFPGPVTLLPSKLKWVVLIVLWVVWAGLFILWFILRISPALPPLSGKALVALLGLAGLAVAPLLLAIFGAATTFGRGMPRLTLDIEGIEMRNIMRYCRRWQEVEQFRSFLFLAFFTDTSPPQERWDRFGRAYLAGKYRIWPDTFGLGAKNLTRLLNAWRERALARQR